VVKSSETLGLFISPGEKAEEFSALMLDNKKAQ